MRATRPVSFILKYCMYITVVYDEVLLIICNPTIIGGCDYP
jgi:hypothetical protein